MENGNNINNEEILEQSKFNLKSITDNLKKTYKSQKTRPIEFRLKQLKSLKKLLEENKQNLVETLKKDLVKHEFEIKLADYCHVMRELNDIISNLKNWANNKHVTTPLFLIPSSSKYVMDPYGVCLIVSPWNYPINLSLVPLMGAIAGGNCVFLKLSRHSYNISKLLYELLPKYLDNECYAFDFEGGSEFITEIIKYKWNHVFFTGSVEVGRIVYQAAAKHLTPVTLELGGKNPTIIDKGMDLHIVSKRICFGKFFNAGQICISTDFVFIHKDELEELIKQIKITLNNFYGEDKKSSEYFGRIISEYHTKRLQSLLQYGKVVIGGECDIEQKYISPTFMVDPQMDSPLMNDEIFGPILPIITYESIDEVIDFLIDRPSPLMLYIFTESKKFENKLIETLPSGNVMINDLTTLYSHPNLSFGGVGDSGMGSYHGKNTFKTFVHKRSVLYTPISYFPSFIFEKVNELKQPPYTNFKDKVSLNLVEIGK